MAGWSASKGQTLNIRNAYEDARFNPEVDRKTGYTTRSILCMPILSRTAEVMGVTQMINKRTGPFGADDEATLEAFTQQVAVALDNARLFERFFALYSYLATLQAISLTLVLTPTLTLTLVLNLLCSRLATLQAHDDFPATLRSITSFASRLLECSHVCVYVHDARTAQLVSRHTEGFPDFSLHRDCGVPGAVFLSGEKLQAALGPRPSSLAHRLSPLAPPRPGG